MQSLAGMPPQIVLPVLCPDGLGDRRVQRRPFLWLSRQLHVQNDIALRAVKESIRPVVTRHPVDNDGQRVPLSDRPD